MELWTDIPNTSSISIISPSGEDTSRIPFHAGSSAELDFLFERTKVSVDYRILVEKTTSELVFFRFNSPAAGIWKIVIEPITVTDGQFHMWLPVTEFIDGEVYFLESDPYYTLTNPANTQSPGLSFPIITERQTPYLKHQAEDIHDPVRSSRT